MKIIHRISVTATPSVRQDLRLVDIIVDDGFVSFDLNEDDDRWKIVEPRLKEWGAVDVPQTKFTARELRDAEWLQMAPSWHHGYPQPDEDNFGYRSITYDTEEHCQSCGITGRQKAPFRMKSEPKWGARSILQLNWVFDEYFATPSAYRGVFAPLNVLSRGVENSAGDRQLDTVVQLVVSTEVSVALDGYPAVPCGFCSRKKFEPIVRGKFPVLKDTPSSHLSHTRQYFGSGGSAHRAIIVSQELYRAILDRKLKGATFVPVCTPSAT